VDLTETIRGLIAKKEKLEKVIADLKTLQGDFQGRPHGGLGLVDGRRKRAGRKSRPPQEREEVSKRMKKYWARRRKEKTGS
jgi:hypothetical protein